MNSIHGVHKVAPESEAIENMKEIIMSSFVRRYLALVAIVAPAPSVMAAASSQPAAGKPQVVTLTLHPQPCRGRR